VCYVLVCTGDSNVEYVYINGWNLIYHSVVY
jgi:hypothetical protein